MATTIMTAAEVALFAEPSTQVELDMLRGDVDEIAEECEATKVELTLQTIALNELAGGFVQQQEQIADHKENIDEQGEDIWALEDELGDALDEVDELALELVDKEKELSVERTDFEDLAAKYAELEDELEASKEEVGHPSG